MKGDFSRPPLWSMACPVSFYPYPNSVLAQQGQPITDWMFNMSLKLIQSDIEDIRFEMSKHTNGPMPTPTVNGDKLSIPATHTTIFGKHVLIPSGTISLSTPLPSSQSIDLDVINDALDLSQLSGVPDHAMVGVCPLAHMYSSFLRPGTSKSPQETVATADVIDASANGDSLRLEVDTIDDKWSPTGTNQMRIRWARNNAGTTVLLNAVDIDNGIFAIAPLANICASDLKDKYGVLELRSSDHFYYDPYTELPAVAIAATGTNTITLGLSPVQRGVIKRDDAQYWLRVWDGVVDIAMAEKDTTSDIGPLKFTWPKKPLNLLRGDSWLAFVRPDPAKGGTVNAKTVFRARAEHRLTLTLQNANNTWSLANTTEAINSPNLVQHERHDSFIPDPQPARVVAASVSNTIRSVRIRDAVPGISSLPLRQWLSSATLDEVASHTVEALRAKVLRSATVPPGELAGFDAELSRVHAAAVQLTMHLPGSVSKALA